MPSYNPEIGLEQLREFRRTRDESGQRMAELVDRVAVNAARDLWPDPTARETAGIGAVVAAATFATFAEIALPGAGVTVLNLIGLFGQYLVDDARAEMAMTDGDEESAP